MIMQSTEKSAAIRALRSAAPYIRMYKGKTFVVKAGGAVFGDAAATRALIEQIAILHYLGIKVVLVHGGGPQLTQVTEAMGVPTRMVQGRRVTDEKSIDATSMVLNGLINTQAAGHLPRAGDRRRGRVGRGRRPDQGAQARPGDRSRARSWTTASSATSTWWTTPC